MVQVVRRILQGRYNIIPGNIQIILLRLSVRVTVVKGMSLPGAGCNLGQYHT